MTYSKYDEGKSILDYRVKPDKFKLVIQDNKVDRSYITQKQLRYIDSSNPNIVSGFNNGGI